MKKSKMLVSIFLCIVILFSFGTGLSNGSLKVSAQSAVTVDGVKDAAYTARQTMVTDKEFLNPGGGSVNPSTSGISATVSYAWDDNYLYFYITSTPNSGILDFRLDPDPQIGTPANLNTNFNPNETTNGHMTFRMNANGTLDNRTAGGKKELLNSSIYYSGNGTTGMTIELKWPRVYPSTNPIDENSFKFSVVLFTASSSTCMAFKTNWGYYYGLTEILFPKPGVVDGYLDENYNERLSKITDKEFTNPAGAPVNPSTSGISATTYYAWDDDYLYFYITTTPNSGILDFRLDPDPKGNTVLTDAFNSNLQTDGHVYFRINADGTFTNNRTNAPKGNLLNQATNFYYRGTGATGLTVELKWPRAYAEGTTKDPDSFRFSVVLFTPSTSTCMAFKSGWTAYGGMVDVFFPSTGRVDGYLDDIYTEDQSFVIDKQFTTAGGAVLPKTAPLNGKIYYAWDSDYLYFYITSTPDAIYVDLRLDPDPKLGTPDNLNEAFNPNRDTDGHSYFRIKADGSFENRTSGRNRNDVANNVYSYKSSTAGYIVEYKYPRTFGDNPKDLYSFQFSVALGLSDGTVCLKNSWPTYAGMTRVGFVTFIGRNVTNDNVISNLTLGMTQADFTSGIKQTTKSVNYSNEYVGTGTTVTVDVNDEITEYTLLLYGDLNGDGMIDTTDISSITNHLLGTNILTGVYKDAANLYGEEDVTLNNLVAIMAASSGDETINQNPLI